MIWWRRWWWGDWGNWWVNLGKAKMDTLDEFRWWCKTKFNIYWGELAVNKLVKYANQFFWSTGGKFHFFCEKVFGLFKVFFFNLKPNSIIKIFLGMLLYFQTSTSFSYYCYASGFYKASSHLSLVNNFINLEILTQSSWACPYQSLLYVLRA